jgi:protein involved in polysaccharide export with SLBB domain
MNKFKKITFFLLFIVCSIVTTAQLPGGINVDQLTDQQLIQYMQQAGLSGLSESELEAKAKEKGLSADQIQKLKARMQTLNLGGGVQGAQNQDGKTATDPKRQGIKYLIPKPSADSINGLLIFGSDIFTKENLTFEPNLTIPTPRNYVLGAGDELKIDIYGFSDKNQTLKVSPDGYIRYPNIGPIKIAGLNFDEATSKLSSALSKIYPGLKSGNTSLQLTLGQIRSIKVNLIGEITKPGSYSVPSLSTIANALYAAGGPTRIGSYRNIELVRGGKSIAKFDLYDYLIKGDLSQNKLLQDDDVIRVAPYSNRIEVRGAVKRNAIYELSNSDRLTNLLLYAGGLADSANKDFVRISRFGNQEKEIFTVTAAQFNSFVLKTGDKLYVDSIANVFKNRVSITGAVYYAGVYALESVSTLKDLLAIAKPKEAAYKERAVIRRLQADFAPAMIGFNLEDVANGKVNVNLQREDSIHIYAFKEIKENFKIQVRGEVNKPDSFYYAQGMQVQDAILMAGGYKDGAYRKFVEVARRIRDTTSAIESPLYATILSVDLRENNINPSLNFQLQPFDIVSIRKAPGYKEQVSVSIEGEVIYPGDYSIVSNQERLSDLVKRAGGLKEGGYPEGAFLLRKTFENLSVNDSVILKNKLATLKASYTDSIKAKAADSSLQGEMKIVGIRLNEVLVNPGSMYDVVLQEGDIIKVPKKVETVQTFNGVYFPKKIVYRSGLTVKQVIEESGGVTPGGQRKRAYIVYPNGEVRTAKHFLFVRSYPKVKPGSEIYVPVKQGKGLSAGELVTITTGLATLATLFLTIRNLTQ